MSLQNYLAKSRESLTEIHSDFSWDETEQIYNHLKEIGHRRHLAFVQEHLGDILKYIEKSRSQRRQKQYQKSPWGLHVRFAALQLSGATEVLHDILNPISERLPGCTYPQYLSTFAEGLASVLFENPLYQFPLDPERNPFEEEE